MFVHVFDFNKCLPLLQPSVALRALPRMTARNAAQVALLSNPSPPPPPHPVNGSFLPPLVPTKDAMFPGADNLGQGLAVQDIGVAANIRHTLPSHPGETATVYTAGLEFCDLNLVLCTSANLVSSKLDNL